jgi:hypothetical protein
MPNDRQATLHGVVFDILDARAASALRLACRAVARGQVHRNAAAFARHRRDLRIGTVWLYRSDQATGIGLSPPLPLFAGEGGVGARHRRCQLHVAAIRDRWIFARSFPHPNPPEKVGEKTVWNQQEQEAHFLAGVVRLRALVVSPAKSGRGSAAAQASR